MILFDVIIPTYNNLNELRLCLSSLENQTINNFHVWVCVDGSDDGTVEFLKASKQFRFTYNVLEHTDKKNQGRAITRNLALPFLLAKYVVLLDSDLQVQNDFLEKHFLVVSKSNCISVGHIHYEPGNIWRDYCMSRGKHQNFSNLSVLPYRYFESGNAMLFTNVFKELKGFDENFKAYGGEDTEFALRVWQKFKLSAIYNQNAVAFGKMEKTLSYALSQREEFAATGLKYIHYKHPELNDLFKIDFLKSNMARFLYHLIPMSLLYSISLNKYFSKKIRLNAVHLQVFWHIYKGFHSKP